MRNHNGNQLYGIQKLLTTLKMGMNKELKRLSLKQKLALNYVSKESKLTRIGDKIYTNTFTPYFPSLAYDRFLKGVISVASGQPLPVVTNFAVTPQCPCNCWHCSFSDRSKKDVLSLDQLKKAIAEGQSLEQARDSVLMEDYSDWEFYAQQRPLNVAGAYRSLTGGR